jgi:hypothetical protein
MLDSYEQPDWQKLEARQQASSTADVYHTVQVSTNAHIQAMAALHDYTREPSSATMQAALDARVHADDADDQLLEAVRTELVGPGQLLGDLQWPSRRIKR